MAAGYSSVTFGGQMITGAVVSRTTIICVQAELLPQRSVAVQWREIVGVPPQPFVVASTKVMETEPPASVAVATPVALVVVLAGHCRIKPAGQVMTGAVVSRTAIVWVQLELLLHKSVAIQRREIVKVLPQFVVVVSE